MSISSYASDSSAASNSHSYEFLQSTTPSRQSGMVQPVVQEMFATVHAAGSSLLGLFSSCTTFDSTAGSGSGSGRAGSFSMLGGRTHTRTAIGTTLAVMTDDTHTHEHRIYRETTTRRRRDVIDAQSDRQTTLTGLGSLRHTIKQGHLGTDNSTRGEQKGDILQKGTHFIWILEIGPSRRREKRCSLCLNSDRKCSKRRGFLKKSAPRRIIRS
eukprot:scaffold6137_cov147-Isochrysis_galbana.AAC.5